MISLRAIPIPTQYFKLITLNIAFELLLTGWLKISFLFYQYELI